MKTCKYCGGSYLGPHPCPALAVIVEDDQPIGVGLTGEKCQTEPADLTFEERRRLEFYVGYLGRMDGDTVSAGRSLR